MRRRAIVGLMAVVTTSALVVGMSAGIGGASVSEQKKAPACAGKTKKKAIKDIKLAYTHFLDGTNYPDAVTDKEPYIQYMSGTEVSPALKAQFEASSAANAENAGLTTVKVNKVTCSGKKSADVDFVLVINGQETPLPQTEGGGKALVEDGTWKVTGETLCNLQSAGDATILESGPCYEIIIEGAPADLTAG